MGEWIGIIGREGWMGWCYIVMAVKHSFLKLYAIFTLSTVDWYYTNCLCLHMPPVQMHNRFYMEYWGIVHSVFLVWITHHDYDYGDTARRKALAMQVWKNAHISMLIWISPYSEYILEKFDHTVKEVQLQSRTITFSVIETAIHLCSQGTCIFPRVNQILHVSTT